jgi:hypothetical protein
MADERPNTLDPWAGKSVRNSYGSQVDDGSGAVGVTIDRQPSNASATTARSSLPGSRARRRNNVDSKTSLLGAFGLGSSFFRGNVKDEMKKQVSAPGSLCCTHSAQTCVTCAPVWLVALPRISLSPQRASYNIHPTL